MKKSNIIMASAAALVSLVAISGVAFSTFAQTNAGSASDNTSTAQNNFKGNRFANLTDAQKLEMQTQMEARQKTMETNQAEIKTAMAQGYDAWVAAVKKINGESAQILSQVTAENFAKYVEASGYMDQAKSYSEKARTILDEIGVQGGMGGGMGRHEDGGMGMMKGL
jgi:hypothetical protein